jgi:hypothetical protein
MKTPDPAFPTFCHISEYGEAGYRNLHRLLAFSAPLNLWAPSSVLIRNASTVEPKAFVKYVDQRFIRIHAREEWLTDPGFRNGHPWSGAAWDREIDDALNSILRNDENEAEANRRVVVAPAEEGFKLAAEHLDQFPGEVDRWNRTFYSSSARSKLPAGTLESAARHVGNGSVAVAKVILRDAYNHGLAVRDSGADAPLLLSSADRRFLELLLEESSPASSGKRPVTKLSLPTELGIQMIEVLRHLDIHRGSADLDSFLRGDGRRLLVSWLGRICDCYRKADPRNVDNIIITELCSDLDRARFARPFKEMLAHPVTTAAGLVDLVLTTVGLVLEPANVLAVTGMAASAVQVAGGTTRPIGFAPRAYTGPQWPFLYAYRRLARPKQVRKLQYVLGELQST